MYSYNPIAQNWNHADGEWASYVGTLAGVEAHHFILNDATAIPTIEWTEPTGTFRVAIATEIRNSGSHAVRINAVTKPAFSFPNSEYRVSFYKNSPFPHEVGAPFHPFTLAGHTETMVVVSSLQSCKTTGQNSVNGRVMIYGPASIPVKYSFLGIQHTAEVLLTPFVISDLQGC